MTGSGDEGSGGDGKDEGSDGDGDGSGGDEDEGSDGDKGGSGGDGEDEGSDGDKGGSGDAGERLLSTVSIILTLKQCFYTVTQRFGQRIHVTFKQLGGPTVSPGKPHTVHS